MYIIADAVAANSASHFPYATLVVGVVGFLAAVSIGSIAWYNSKRPAGWENKERPDIVPEVDKSKNPGLG